MSVLTVVVMKGKTKLGERAPMFAAGVRQNAPASLEFRELFYAFRAVRSG